MDDAGTVVTDKVPIRETWEAMESLVDDGIAKSISISNASAQLLYDMQTCARHLISVRLNTTLTWYSRSSFKKTVSQSQHIRLSAHRAFSSFLRLSVSALRM
jgi:diketogulonate reductase-like aldo/keto reductase